MRLSELLSALPEAPALTRGPDSEQDPVIRGVCVDSRAVAPGDLFVALRGHQVDGHRFLAQALELGATALLVEGLPPELDLRGAARRSCAIRGSRWPPLATRFYGAPASELTLVGVTGTNGKTTSRYLVESILRAAGRRPGVIGTVGYRFAGERRSAAHTTPDAASCSAAARACATRGATHVVMEVSSHGLALGRVDGLPLRRSRAFTNLTQDHLDFHGSMEAYGDAKSLLFSRYLSEPGRGGRERGRSGRGRICAAARGAGARVLRVSRSRAGLRDPARARRGAHRRHARARARVRTPRSNSSCRSSATSSSRTRSSPAASESRSGSRRARSRRASRAARRCPGASSAWAPSVSGADGARRLRAHARRARQACCARCAPLTRGRLLCVFGCGGDRDRSKRPLMAARGRAHAELVIVTSDNPRTEDPARILADVERGFAGLRRVAPEELVRAERAYAVVVDRRAAIELAIRIAGAERHRPDRRQGPRGLSDHRAREVALQRRRRGAPRAPEARRVSAAYRAAEAARWMGGRWLQGDPATQLRGASIDSRSVAAGDLFLAIVGPRHDAHAYLAGAVARGASALAVQRGSALPGDLPAALPLIEVDDTTRALGRLAAGHRREFQGPVVAITGSNGKTTTKEMTASALAQAGPCLKTEGNLNNQFGLPLTLLRREAQHRALVVEIGMNHRGEIQPLAEIARPGVAVLTNVGTAHIEHLGTREAIALEKGDLLLGLDARGIAVLNADDAYVMSQAPRAPGRVLRFGRAAAAEVRALEARPRGGGYAIDCATPHGRVQLELSGLGESTVANALAACAAALAAGASLAEIAAGLRAYRPPHGRLEPFELPNGATLVDDSYNANPQSMAVALRAIAALRDAQGGSRRGRCLAVLGAMGELGLQSERSHRELGALAAELEIDALVVVGDAGAWIASGASAAGLGAARVFACANQEEAAGAASAWLRAGDVALVKGSRSARMERVVELLLAEKRD